MAADLKVSLLVDDKGSVKVRKFASVSKKELTKLGGLVSTKLGGAFRKVAKTAATTFSGITKQLLSIKGLLVGIGVSLVAKSFLDAAGTAEQYRVRLNALLGSTEEGNKLFEAMNDYASKTPFEFEQIMGAAVQLSGVMKGGVAEIVEWMPLIGDLAAVSGLSIQQTTEQVVRMYSAGAGAADLFRERGILAMLGFQAGVSYTAEETRKKLMDSWNATDSQFKDVTDALAGTWKGLMTMFKDKWFIFRKAVMDSKVFKKLKDTAGAILNLFDKWKDDGSIQKWAETTGAAAIKAFKIIIEWTEKAVSAGIWLYTTFLKIRLLFDSMVSDYSKSTMDRMDKIIKITKTAGKMSGAPVTRMLLGSLGENWEQSMQPLRDLAASSKQVTEQHGQELIKFEKQLEGLRKKYDGFKTAIAEKSEAKVDTAAAVLSVKQIGDTWHVTTQNITNNPAEIKAANTQAIMAMDGLREAYLNVKRDIESNPITPVVIHGAPSYSSGQDYDFNISGTGEEAARQLKDQMDTFTARGIE